MQKKTQLTTNKLFAAFDKQLKIKTKLMYNYLSYS